MIRRPPRSPLFPSTTLSRSSCGRPARRRKAVRRSPCPARGTTLRFRSEEHTSELQSQSNLVCRLLLEKKKKKTYITSSTQSRSTHKIYIHYIHATSAFPRLV